MMGSSCISNSDRYLLVERRSSGCRQAAEETERGRLVNIGVRPRPVTVRPLL